MRVYGLYVSEYIMILISFLFCPLKIKKSVKLTTNIDIMIGTLGHLIDFMHQEGLVLFRRIKFTVMSVVDVLTSSNRVYSLEKVPGYVGKQD